MSIVKSLRCRECGKDYPVEPSYVCEFCFGSLEVVYDYEALKGKFTRKLIESRPENLWRYRELLPIDGEPTVGLDSGFTPLFRALNLEKELGCREIYIKDDSVCHPTLSFKDRVVAVALTKALEFGFETVACASTGNLGNAVSAHAAKAGLKRFIFIPSDLELGKIIGSLVYDPNLVTVHGSYDDVNRLCSEIGSKYRWAFVNINMRTFYSEGSKTYGFEVAEQLGWKTPKHIIVPAASGSLITKIHKGFKEFEKLGLIDKADAKIYCAQAEGCSPITTMLQSKSDVILPVKPNTIAKSLAIGNPADGYYAADVIRSTGGAAELATNDEIREAILLLARTEGVFTETAGGVTLACAIKLIRSGVIPKNESIVISITGNGLKTQEAIQNSVKKPTLIEPHLKSFEERVELETCVKVK